jgi:hypothetical protein
METKENLLGLYLIEVADPGEAMDWARRMPAHDGQTVEVRAAIVATLARRLGDLQAAEDAAAEAFAAAAGAWARDGIPPKPGGWLMLTAWRKAVDAHRRDAVRRGVRDRDRDGGVHRQRAPGIGGGGDLRVPPGAGCLRGDLPAGRAHRDGRRRTAARACARGRGDGGH